MILSWKRGQDFNITKNFLASEIECKCGVCKDQIISRELLEKLQKVRELFGKITITSGYRCKAHNTNVGGKPASKHLTGEGCDIIIEGIPKNIVADFCEYVFNGVGDSTAFTHVDVRTTGKTRWKY